MYDPMFCHAWHPKPSRVAEGGVRDGSSYLAMVLVHSDKAELSM
jgi:hypothetical protein